MMKKLVLTLFVLLAVAGYSLADDAAPTGVATEVANGSASYETYRVGLTVDPTGAGISVVDDLSVTVGLEGVPGQAVQLMLMGSTPTPDETYLAFMGTNAIFDTHILSEELKTLTGSTSQAGDGWTEDNDGSLAGDLGAGFGVGDLYLKNDPSAIALNNYDATYPAGLYELTFLQVVVPAGKTVTVSGRYTNPARAALALDPIPFSFTVGTVGGDPPDVPEPSTIVMLVLGALCVVGIRLRRK